jgi:transposase
MDMSKPDIQLSPDASRQLHDLSKSPLSSIYRNARIILLTADGMPAINIAHALGVSVRSVRNTIRVFKDGGLGSLTCRGTAGRPPELTAEQREAIIDLLRKHPSEFGIDKSSWTALDLAMVAGREKVVGKTSSATVRRVISDAGLDWHAAKRLCEGKATPDDVTVEDDEIVDTGIEESMSLLGFWSSAFAKSKADQEGKAGKHLQHPGAALWQQGWS